MTGTFAFEEALILELVEVTGTFAFEKALALELVEVTGSCAFDEALVLELEDEGVVTTTFPEALDAVLDDFETAASCSP